MLIVVGWKLYVSVEKDLEFCDYHMGANVLDAKQAIK